MCTLDWVKPKARILKGIFGRRTKDVFYLSHYEPPDVMYDVVFSNTVRTCTLMHADPGKGTLNGTILSGRCFLRSKCNIT